MTKRSAEAKGSSAQRGPSRGAAPPAGPNPAPAVAAPSNPLWETLSREPPASGVDSSGPPIAAAGGGSPPLAPVVLRQAPSDEAAPVVVDDDAVEVLRGQMRMSDFLDALRPAVCAAVDEVLATTGQSTEECSYLRLVLRVTQVRGSRFVNEMLARFAPDVDADAGALAYVPFIVQRAREAAQRWVETGRIEGLPAGLPEAQAEGDSSAGADGLVLPKSRHRAGSVTANPRMVRARLGPGSALPVEVRGRMEPAFGTRFDHVRVHTDPDAARMAGDLHARAFAVGEHIAFAPGEYHPGDPLGEALLAHELAHVVQQGGGRAAGTSTSDAPALEREADNAATAIARSRGGGAGQGPSVMPGRAGLRLQRCDSLFLDEHELSTEENEAFISRNSIRLTLDPEPPEGATALVGQTIVFQVSEDVPSSERWYNWEFTYPDGSTSGSDLQREWSIGVSQSGEYVARASGHRLEEGRYLRWNVERRFTAITPELASEQAVADVDPQSFDAFMASQDVLVGFLRPGSQPSSGDFRIVTSAANPALAGDAGASLSYTVERTSGRGDTRFHWYLSPMNSEGLGDEFGGARRVTEGETTAYDLGTGSSASFRPIARNVFVVRCVVEDGAGQRLDEVRYLQSVLDQPGMEQLAQFEAYMQRAQERIGGLHPSQRLGLAAMHVSTATNARSQLRLFLGRSAPDSAELVLLDLTPGLDPEQHTLEYRGSTTGEVMAQFRDANRYPEGAVNIVVPSNDLNIEAGRWEFATSGATLLGVLSGGFGIGAMVLGLLGLALAPFTEGGSLVVTMLIVGSAVAGVTSGVLSLVDRFRTAEVSTTGVIIDVAGIAGSLIGGASAVRAAMRGTVVLAASSTTRYLLWSGFASDLVAFLLISVEGMQQIRRVLDSDLNPDEQRGAIVRILTGLIITGGLLAVSARDLRGVRSRLRGTIGTEVEAALSQETRVVLGTVLDEPTLRGLAGLEAPDLERLAAILREDPTAAARIVGARSHLRGALATGASTASELEFAILRLRLQGARVPSAQVDRLAAALRAARVPGANLGQVDGEVLASLRRLDDALARGDMSAAIAAADALPSSLFGADARAALEQALAGAHNRTALSSYRNPQALVAGRTVPPTSRGGTLFHGASGPDMSPTTVFERGMPARGPDVDIGAHVLDESDSAFRGTTAMLMTPDGEGGAARWADAGGWVYEIDGTPSWDASQVLEGRLRGPGGFGGNPLPGELETVILAGVPRERIRGAYPVIDGGGTRVRLGTFENNPHYRAP